MFRPAFIPPVLAVAALFGCSGELERNRVFLLALDGVDPRTIELLVGEGKLPNFARLTREGRSGLLASEEPLLSPVVWTTIATGRRPVHHGIGHFTAADPSGRQLPVTSAQRRVQALWNIVSAAELDVASVGWWATWPPEEIRGWMVSDRVGYHFLFEPGADDGALGGKTHPASLAERLRPHLARYATPAQSELETYAVLTPDELNGPLDFDNDVAHLNWAVSTAKSYRDIALDLWENERPDLTLLYIEGTDSVSHLFGHLFRNRELEGDLARQYERFGQTVEAMYVLADDILGDVLAALDESTTLIVLSDHGFELGALHDDPSKTRDLRRVSERFHTPTGIIYLVGRGVPDSGSIEAASILDIAPTVLDLLGLAASDEMPGRSLVRDGGEGTIPRIATYEMEPAEDLATASVPSNEDRLILQRLESLGYLSGSAAAPEATTTVRNEVNLAGIHFREGRFREAGEIYARLLAVEPDNSRLHTSLAGVLGALGQYDRAVGHLERAIELEPLNVEAYHNRGTIHERRGSMEAAMDDYRRALLYSPLYEPSRSALLRLTGTDNPRAAEPAANVPGVDELLERASLAARRGAYDEAMQLLDSAEEMAPDYALVYQYRSNVAYLAGDVAAATEALERALELEPSNELFKSNLKELQGTG